MIVFFVMFILIALAGIFFLGGNGLSCALLLAAAGTGAVLSLLLKGRKRFWTAILVPVCLLCCLFMGQRMAGGMGEYHDRLYAAAAQIEKEDLDRGVELLDALDEEYGITDRSLYVRAGGWLSLGEYGEARSCLEQVQDRTDRNWYLYMEKIYAVEGTEEELAELYLTAAEKLPEDSYMQYMVGLVRLSGGAYESAAYYFQRAAKLDENEALSCYYLGVICQEQGKTKEAGQYFEEAMRRGVDEEKKAYIQWYLEQMGSI